MPIPVILDTDIGSDIDDTWALAMLLNCPELDPKLILTATGDTLYRAHLTARFLDVAGRTDIPIGIGSGSPEGTPYFQKPWLKDYDSAHYPGTIYPHGVDAMIDLIMNSSEPITIISIAPADNLALALAREPGIAARCRFIGMYGSLSVGYDGEEGATAETNVRLNVPAARQVFTAPWQSALVTPLDTCGRVVLEGARFQRLATSTRPPVCALMENYRIWAKLVDWMKVDYADSRSSALFDTVAIYLAYNTDFVEVESLPVIVTDDGYTRIDSAGSPMNWAIRWTDLNAFYDHLVERLDPPVQAEMVRHDLKQAERDG